MRGDGRFYSSFNRCARPSTRQQVHNKWTPTNINSPSEEQQETEATSPTNHIVTVDSVVSPHIWEFIPFSSHHGWEDPAYYCGVCETKYKGPVEKRPVGPCIYF